MPIKRWVVEHETAIGKMTLLLSDSELFKLLTKHMVPDDHRDGSYSENHAWFGPYGDLCFMVNCHTFVCKIREKW
jgi:hypothetical protein